MATSGSSHPDGLDPRLHALGRACTLVGLVTFTGFIVWHIAVGRSGGALLSGSLIAVEIGLLIGSAALAWALWQRPSPTPTGDAPPVETASDVVVRLDDEPIAWLEATLVALTSTEGVRSITVIDMRGRPEADEVCSAMRVELHRTGGTDGAALSAAMSCAGTRALLLLDAGDVPAPDALRRLQQAMSGDDVAAVQGLLISHGGDAVDRSAHGAHELTFERMRLNPALAARGYGFITESGMLLRRRAFIDIDLRGLHREAAHWMAAATATDNGWRITSCTDAVVVAPSEVRHHRWSADRTVRAQAARRLLTRRRKGAATGAAGRRLVALAWAVRPLSGARRSLFCAVIVATLLAGRLPITADPVALAALWLPGFALTSVGLAALSGWTLRPGDRTRWSLRTIGAVWRSLAVPPCHVPPRHDTEAVVSDRPLLGNHGALVMTMVLLSGVIIVRGISQRATSSLAAMPEGWLAGAMLCAVWQLGMSLDAMRLLAGRGYLRRATRVPATITAEVAGRSVLVADLTPFGAGVVDHGEIASVRPGVQLGDVVDIAMSLPTASGVTSAVLRGEVRNLRPDPTGARRIGLEFIATERDAALALAEFCIVQPARLALTSTSRPAALTAAPAGAPERRLPLRLVAIGALIGAALSTAPVSAADDEPMPSTTVSGDIDDLVDATAPDTSSNTQPEVTEPEVTEPEVTEPGATEPDATAPEVTTMAAVCSLEAGNDGLFGTADDGYGTPLEIDVGNDGSFSALLDGQACWMVAATASNGDPADGDPGIGDTAGGAGGDDTQNATEDDAPSLIVWTVAMNAGSGEGTRLVAGSATAPAIPQAAGIVADAVDAQTILSSVVARRGAIDGGSGAAPRWLPEPPAEAIAAGSAESSDQRQLLLPLIVVVITVALAASVAIGLGRPRRSLVEAL